MEVNNKTPRGFTNDYNHVTNWNKHFNKNILPAVFSWGPIGPPMGYKDYIKFYE